MDESETHYLATRNWWVDTLQEAHFHFSLQAAKSQRTRFHNFIENETLAHGGTLPLWAINGSTQAKIVEVIIENIYIEDK